MTSAYLLTVPGNSPMEISRDELRSLLGEIENDLHQSKVYRRAVATLQKLLGTSAEQAHLLFKAVGREAIGLAFEKFTQHEKVTEDNQPSETQVETPVVEEADYTELSHCLTNVKPQQKSLPSNPANIGGQEGINSNLKENSPNKKVLTRWLDKKPRQAELAQKAADKRRDSLRQIGEKLRQARESQNLSLTQLNVYTHVPISSMEAVENGNWDLLPEDVFVRGFIRVMGNALGLNGTHLASCLPATPEQVKKNILPYKYQPKGRNFELQLPSIHPAYLYVGYTALVAGSVGGLSVLSQQANANKLHPEAAMPPSSVTQSLQDKKEPITKPGLQSSTAGVSVGADISRPETL
ncbi:helix-turn-helix domain-containing protein [Iningainema tapete]